MAFLKHEFTKGEQKFDEWLNEETQYIQITISSSPFNSGVVPTSEELIGKEHMNLMWALRDTFLSGFLSGLKNQQNPHPIPDENTRRGIDSLVCLALILSSEVIA